MESLPNGADANQKQPAWKYNPDHLAEFDAKERERWLPTKLKLAKNPGWFYRRWDVSMCKQQIRRAAKEDLPDLRIALQKEEASKKPRKRLIPYLRARIEALEAEDETSAQ
ncbi:MAG: hypothetical protein EOP88_16870 [Verrucomicrobiaceae bacterium]|nr:MAG: hypothetical protein EOP88_16870 [Verrucomicrobiaceae bacterium]